MEMKERWNHLLVALSLRPDPNVEILADRRRWRATEVDLRDALQSEREGWALDSNSWAIERAGLMGRVDALVERVRELDRDGRHDVVQIVQHNDAVGQLTITMRAPDGNVVEAYLDSANRVSVPEGFRVLQIGAISPNVPFGNPSSPGTLIANAMRRFNDNVLRFPDFKGIVRDEGMHLDGNDLGTSTVLLEFGKRKYEILVTCRERLNVPIGAIADPKIEDPRGN